MVLKEAWLLFDRSQRVVVLGGGGAPVGRWLQRGVVVVVVVVEVCLSSGIVLPRQGREQRAM